MNNKYGPFPLEGAKQLYDSGMTLDEVGAAIGYAGTRPGVLVRRYFVRAGVQLRTRSQSQQSSYDKTPRSFKPRTGDQNPAWKGGRKIDKSGYVLVHEPDHPQANSQGYVREHRRVMELQIGRPLSPEEVVHHKDGDKANNHPDNLDLFANNGVHKSLEMFGVKRDEAGKFLATGS